MHSQGMRTGCRRKKKLTIAFWFSRQSEPGWKCAECRALGLIKNRNCGFLALTPTGFAAPVWAGGDIVLNECPKPLISGESIAFIEAYWLWRFQGRPAAAEQSARCMDAFVLLERLSRQAAQSQPQPSIAQERLPWRTTLQQTGAKET